MSCSPARPSLYTFTSRNRKAGANKAEAVHIHTLSCQQRHTLYQAVQIAKSEIVAHIISAPARERENRQTGNNSRKSMHVHISQICSLSVYLPAPCSMCERVCFIQGGEIQQILAGAHTRRFVVYLHSCVCAARVSQQTNEPLQCCRRSQLFARRTQDVSSLAGEVC